jgi:hypothetical protein
MRNRRLFWQRHKPDKCDLREERNFFLVLKVVMRKATTIP